MPIYEYVCLDCGSHFDALRQMKDADRPINCQECESERTLRQISIFFAQSAGRTIAGGNGGGCAGCSGGTCAACNN